MKRTFLLNSLLLLCALLGGVNPAWGDEIVVNSSQSAYVDAANTTTNYNGADDNVTSLQINNTQFRDWASGSDGSMKFNSSGKVALYKFALASLKSVGTITNVTFTIKGQTNDAGNKSTSPVRVLGYNPSWDAATITQATLVNNGNSEALTGTVAGKGSFQPLNDTDGLTINVGETTLNVNATTYVLSAIDADNDYVTIALAVNLGRVAYLEKTAKLTVTYTTETTYDVTFSESNGVSAVVKMSGTDVSTGTKLSDGTYDFTATAVGYNDYNGNFTVSGANKDVEFTMTAKDVYTYTINAVAGDVFLEELASGSDYDNDNVPYHFKQVINHEGTLYEAAPISSAYKTSFTLDENDKVVNHFYSQPATPVTNIVFLAEAEEVFAVGTGSSADTRCSMGAGGYASSKTAFVNLVPGKYILKISNRCSGDRTGIHNFYKGDDAEPFFSANGNGYNAVRTSDEFTLMETTTLYMLGGDNNQYVDWLYIVKTADVTVPVSVTAVGYATLCPAYNLDFTGATAIEACKAAIAGDGTITYTRVNTVKAGEGVLLHSISGGAAEEEIPVIADATPNDDNAFVGVAAEQKLAQTVGGYTNYILLNGAGGLGFYRVNANGSYVRAGSAYLKVAADAARASYLFDDEITAVNSLTPAISEGNGTVYNLSGQRVEKPTKGVYIKNGKKVIVK